MEKEELQIIIDQLESANSNKDNPYFGIFQYGGGPDESFVKANKQGLQLFAIELLKSSRDANDIISDKEKSVILLDLKDEWINGDTFIDYVEPILEFSSNDNLKSTKISLKDQSVKIGCFAIVIILIIAVIVGLLTIGK